MNAFFVMSDGSKVTIKEKLAEVFSAVFSSASASSNVQKRGEYAQALVKHFEKVPAFAEFDKLVIDTEDETITVLNHNLLAVLSGIPSAIALNEAYKEVWSKVDKHPADTNGKRGRKATNAEAELLAALD